MPNQGAPGGGDKSFHDLLAQLAQKYDQEVTYLRTEIQNLKASAALKEGKLPSTSEPLRTAANIKPKDAQGPHEPRSPGLDPPRLPANPTPSGEVVDFLQDAEEVVDGSDEEDSGFALKGAWIQIPEATGSWGHELDEIMVTTQAAQLCERSQVEEQTEDPLASKASMLDTSARRFYERLMINPASPRRMAWDIAGMLLIFYDMISIPMIISFEPADHPVSTFMGWVTLCFWTCDVFGSCFTGIYVDGKLCMSQKKIVINYLKGWFWIDMVVVVPDWVMKGLGSTTNIAGMARILRAARIMRVLRMLRLLKLKKLLAIVYDMIDSEYMWIVFGLIKLLCALLIMNHVVGCAWYLIGRLGRGVYPKCWLEDLGITPLIDKETGIEQGLTFKYLTSLHWSITQFTPASMDISATNSLERGFSIGILFWAMVALASIIGNVSASMTALRNMGSDEMQKFWMLRRYFKQKQISRELSERIVRYLEYECNVKRDIVPATKVSLLGFVSENLKLELAKEMHAPLLECHPFFNYVSEEIPALMFRLCHQGLRTTLYAMNDQPFQAGDEGLSMYFFKVGLFEYKLVNGHVLPTPLGPKTWASEAVLWTMWRHRGSLTALRPSEVVEIQPKSFIDVFRMHPRPYFLGQHYGSHFVQYMNLINKTALTDVLYDLDVFEKLVVKSTEEIKRKQSCQAHGGMERGISPAKERGISPLSPKLERDDSGRKEKVAWA